MGKSCGRRVWLFLSQAEDGIRDWAVTGVQTCAFFFQAEDGIRDWSVTGVQTCALPISGPDLRDSQIGREIHALGAGVQSVREVLDRPDAGDATVHQDPDSAVQIGRASCRERV